MNLFCICVKGTKATFNSMDDELLRCAQIMPIRKKYRVCALWELFGKVPPRKRAPL